MKAGVMPSERGEMAIVGAGYAGINALNAASKYLQRGDRVIVVDRGQRWGGQWVRRAPLS